MTPNLKEADPILVCEHLQRLIEQSGANGAPLYNAFNSKMRANADSATVIDAGDLREKTAQSLKSPRWYRCWTSEAHARVVAHSFLMGGNFATEMHRAEITVGVEFEWRRKGLGRSLVESALQWAIQKTDLSWIDLQMIAVNEPALALYRRFGFKESSKISDRYRVDGFAVESLTMALNLDKLRR